MLSPFFDPSELSEKELMNKIDEVSGRIIKARMAGIDYNVVESMKMIIATCEEELRTRYGIKALEEAKKSDPCIFQSDYDYSKEDEIHESTKKSINRPKW